MSAPELRADLQRAIVELDAARAQNAQHVGGHFAGVYSAGVADALLAAVRFLAAMLAAHVERDNRQGPGVN